MLFGHDEGKNIKQLCNGKDDVVCVAMGGTGANNAADARSNIFEGQPLAITEGGTGANTAAGAIANLGIADYIIESGEVTLSSINTEARWEKWASGKAVMEFKYSGTAAADSVWTSPIYYRMYDTFSNVFTDIKSGLFIEAPNVIVTSNSSIFIGIIPGSITENGIGSLRYLSVNNRPSTSGEASFRAVGKWK